MSLAFLSSRLRASRLARLGDGQRGFTIIEVLVSAILLAMAATGLFLAFDSATKASGTNKSRTIAAQLAQADQERLRSLTGSQLVALNTAAQVDRETRKTVDRKEFTITSSAAWVSDPNSTTSCGGLGKEPGYQKITSSVSWPDRGALAPVEATSYKAVPNGGYSTTRGSLAVKLGNAAGNGTSGISVSISGPSSATATTNSSGCALFGFLPLGTYTVNINQAGYVRDALPNAQQITKSVVVAGEQTSSVSYNYDQAASLGVAFSTRNPSSSTDTTTTGDGFSVNNSGLGSPYFIGFGLLSTQALTAATGTNTAAVAPASAQKVLYPFSDGYRVYAGQCQENDPLLAPNNVAAASDPAGSATMTPGGATTNVKVIEPMLKITVKRYTNSQQTSSSTTSQAARVKITPATTGCTAPLTVDTTSTGTIADASQPTMPYGNYTVCVQDKTSSPTRRATTTVTNNVRNGQNLTLYLPYNTTNPTSC